MYVHCSLPLQLIPDTGLSSVTPNQVLKQIQQMQQTPTLQQQQQHLQQQFGQQHPMQQAGIMHNMEDGMGGQKAAKKGAPGLNLYIPQYKPNPVQGQGQPSPHMPQLSPFTPSFHTQGVHQALMLDEQAQMQRLCFSDLNSKNQNPESQILKFEPVGCTLSSTSVCALYPPIKARARASEECSQEMPSSESQHCFPKAQNIILRPPKFYNALNLQPEIVSSPETSRPESSFFFCSQAMLSPGMGMVMLSPMGGMLGGGAAPMPIHSAKFRGSRQSGGDIGDGPPGESGLHHVQVGVSPRQYTPLMTPQVWRPSGARQVWRLNFSLTLPPPFSYRTILLWEALPAAIGGGNPRNCQILLWEALPAAIRTLNPSRAANRTRETKIG